MKSSPPAFSSIFQPVPACFAIILASSSVSRFASFPSHGTHFLFFRPTMSFTSGTLSE